MLSSIFALVARFFIATYFLTTTFQYLFLQRAGNFTPTFGTASPKIIFLTEAIIGVGGGILLLLGARVRIAAMALATLALSQIAAALFASTPIPSIALVLKDLAIVGGLLQIMAFGAGRFSLDGR